MPVTFRSSENRPAVGAGSPAVANPPAAKAEVAAAAANSRPAAVNNSGPGYAINEGYVPASVRIDPSLLAARSGAAAAAPQAGAVSAAAAGAVAAPGVAGVGGPLVQIIIAPSAAPAAGNVAPAQQAGTVQKVDKAGVPPFSWPARLVAKISKRLARAFGWATLAVGGTSGVAVTGAFLARLLNPVGMGRFLHSIGMSGLLGPQSAALTGVLIFAGLTVGAILQASSFFAAGRAAKKNE